MIDREFLSRHASFVDAEIEERALHIEVGDGLCFALLYRPAEPKETGFVVCHSYGLEFLTLRRTERALARALSVQGYPVIAVHCRGFGDSSGSLAQTTLESVHEDVRAAAERLSALTGTRRLGLIGARLGGLTAGTVAQAGDVDRLVLINPALDGKSYFRQMIREMRLVKLTQNERSSVDDHLRQLREGGMLDVLGNDVYAHFFDAVADVDLAKDMGTFTGDVLAFQVSKRPALQRNLSNLRQTVQDRGGSCEVEFVKEPPGATFGGPAFVNTGDSNTRVDVQTPIVDHITRRTKEWMSS
ncbi:MAG: alpha/beta fold hydrolase [Actinomycetota bacterium]